ncbi:hypothetical protein LV779_12720 [Streptomyces thinghirensis]|nr:hypothetical protein [Streptomyces thinghirensis]
MTAFFREGLDIGDRSVLVRLAEEAGLDPAAYARRPSTSRSTPSGTGRHWPSRRG